MTNFTIFKEEYTDLFTIYGYSVDTIEHILLSLGYNLSNLYSNEARSKGLLAINQLLEHNIIEISYLNNKPFKRENLKTKKKTSEIEKLWANKNSKIDFELIVNFKYQDWYLKKMKEIPIDLNTDWEWFAKEFVPNMRQWIDKNKPKQHKP